MQETSFTTLPDVVGTLEYSSEEQEMLKEQGVLIARLEARLKVLEAQVDAVAAQNARIAAALGMA